MDIFKKAGKIYLTSLKFEELLTLLKIQINCELIFSQTGQSIDPTLTITLGERLVVGNIQQISYSIGSQNFVDTYDSLLSKISVNTKIYNLSATLDQNDFRLQESLIRLIPDINSSITNDCVYISFANEIYTICYKKFANGDSNILYYFEVNNTLLAFTEEGPVLYTENPNMNNITDIICN